MKIHISYKNIELRSQKGSIKFSFCKLQGVHIRDLKYENFEKIDIYISAGSVGSAFKTKCACRLK